MAKLITNHDPMHLHLLLGSFAILHFILRFVYFFVKGSGFPMDESLSTQIMGVMGHGILSWSSLFMPLPKKRNFSAPMIWPEFRLHSILFASRHVLCTLISLCNLWPKQVVFLFSLKLSIILATNVIAKIITSKTGSITDRTTNSMPYPSNISKEEQQGIKKQYAIAQFHATMQGVNGDAFCAFIPLLGIQAAPFLMTLVRKGKITPTIYHRVYAFTLWVPYLLYLIRYFQGSIDIAQLILDGVIAIYICRNLRIYFKLSAELVWILGISLSVFGFQFVLKPLVEEYVGFDNIYFNVWLVSMYIYSMTYPKRKYLPLLRPQPSKDIQEKEELKTTYDESKEKSE